AGEHRHTRAADRARDSLSPAHRSAQRDAASHGVGGQPSRAGQPGHRDDPQGLPRATADRRDRCGGGDERFFTPRAFQDDHADDAARISEAVAVAGSTATDARGRGERRLGRVRGRL
ncbi:hypothetical protein QT19_00145, partial [Staphylococcus aureus]